MPYEPDKQQQQSFEQVELELMQRQQDLEELQQHQRQHQPQRRDSYGWEERLPANPSLSSWQTAAAAQGGRASRGGVSVAGSRLGQQGSGSRIEALLDDFEQGDTPSLLDLAEL